MRLTMMPKRPVVFPDFDPRRVLGDVPCSTTAQAWKAYGEALLDFNEPCMEACESTSEIVDALYVQRSGICARENGGERFRLSDGRAVLALDGSADGGIFIRFPEGAGSVDVSDFGPSDVARFIRALFSAYDRIASLRLQNQLSTLSFIHYAEF